MGVRVLCAVNAAHQQRWNEPAEATGRADQPGDRAGAAPSTYSVVRSGCVPLTISWPGLRMQFAPGSAPHTGQARHS